MSLLLRSVGNGLSAVPLGELTYDLHWRFLNATDGVPYRVFKAPLATTVALPAFWQSR